MNDGFAKFIGGGINSHKIFEKIISLENLFLAWKEFKRGKGKKADVRQFELDLEENIFKLHKELAAGDYAHSQYTAFSVCDPKPRQIHKAVVRDRVLHHAVFRVLYPLFDSGFIFDSYSCRLEKGTHRGIKRLEIFLKKASYNNENIIFALKCDIKKFFASVNQDILLRFLEKKIKDERVVRLLGKIIHSFPVGLPLGNVTSQLFANIYLNELDQFAKHKLKIKYYLRYSDDFVILGESRDELMITARKIGIFLKEKLKLLLHPDKIIVRKFSQGIDFLGYVLRPNCITLRTKTKRMIIKKIARKFEELKNEDIPINFFNQSLQSYFGVLRHCRGRKIEKNIKLLTQRQPLED